MHKDPLLLQNSDFLLQKEPTGQDLRSNGMFDSTGCTAAIARETSFEEMQVLKIPSKMYYSSSHVVLLRAVGRSRVRGTWSGGW